MMVELEARSCSRQEGTRLVMTMVVLLIGASTLAGAAASYHHGHPLGLNNRLNRMVDHVESSIWEKKQRLGGMQSLAPHEHYMEEEDVTVVETPSAEQETNTEDMQDYVNNAPWTRRTAQTQQATTIDMQMITLAAQNAQRVKNEGRCELPQRRCEAIRPPRNSGDVVFFPRCALLHRCSEDTGCCLSDDNVCAPAETETVDLFFYAFGGMRAKIEVMTFVNHTRCSCQARSSVVAESLHAVDCKCPRHYSPKAVDGQCSCDCDEGRTNKCRRYKKGRRYFSPADIRCISSGECVEPSCEYGPFLMRQRRCTKRRERERYVTNRK